MPGFTVYAYQEMEPVKIHPFDSAFADYLDHWVIV